MQNDVSAEAAERCRQTRGGCRQRRGAARNAAGLRAPSSLVWCIPPIRK
jgi:hypothetical protein